MSLQHHGRRWQCKVSQMWLDPALSTMLSKSSCDTSASAGIILCRGAEKYAHGTTSALHGVRLLPNPSSLAHLILDETEQFRIE